MQTHTMEAAMPAADLAARWRALTDAQPKIRIRDAATQLGVSEMALVALDCGDAATRLAGDWGDMIKRFPTLGRIMSLTRNESAVHERRGCYDKVSIHGKMGLVLNKEIDLRLLMDYWAHGFAVETPRADGVLKSFQFFDASGTAIQKIYMTEDSIGGAYEALREEFESADQSTDVDTVPPPPAEPERRDREIDVTELRDGWAGLRDVHDFAALIKRFGVARTQSFRLVGSDYCRPVANGALRQLLNEVAATAFPIMVFVGNRGCIQIHSGPVTRIERIGDWVNVLDRDFNLHLREDRIAESWVVRKPTAEGVVTSLELFDGDGSAIATLFSLRDPGHEESADWRGLLGRLSDA